ncbi:MAG: Chromate resistance protein ChrB [Sulfobacillus sp.]
MPGWVLLHYQVPATPSASRVQVWRKLKGLGALLLHDSVWILPATPWTTEQFQWLASDLRDAHGDAMVWQAEVTLPSQEGELIDHFQRASEREYQALWEELQGPEPVLESLARRFQQVRRRDYFGCPLGQQVYQALGAQRGE